MVAYSRFVMNPTMDFQGERTEGRFERTLSVTGPVTLDVSTKSGVIRVRRGEAGSVTVRGVLRVRPSVFGWSHRENQVQRLASQPPVEQNGDTIRIGDVRDRWLLRRVHMLVEITVPAETRVRALSDSGDLRVEGICGPVDCETDSGEIQISNIDSQVTAASDSGAIQVRGVGGSLEVRTDSGAIEALEIGGSIDAEADSGNIHLSQTIVAPVCAHSDSGRIRVQLATGGSYTVSARTDNGWIDIPDLTRLRSSRRNVEGDLGGGGSMVDLETDSGEIQVIRPA